MMKAVGEAYKEIKAERLRNLSSISADSGLLKTGKIPPVKELIERLEGCTTWNQIKESICILRETRFLGSPKRTEISTALIKSLARVYEDDSNEEALVNCLDRMFAFEQMNPLILSSQLTENTTESDAFKTVLYTALDIHSRK